MFVVGRNICGRFVQLFQQRPRHCRKGFIFGDGCGSSFAGLARSSIERAGRTLGPRAEVAGSALGLGRVLSLPGAVRASFGQTWVRAEALLDSDDLGLVVGTSTGVGDHYGHSGVVSGRTGWCSKHHFPRFRSETFRTWPAYAIRHRALNAKRKE